MVSLHARFSLVSGVKLSIVTQSAISWLNALTHRKKKDLLIHTLNGYSMFSEHPTHHVFCNIYLYFSHSKSDETIIRTIPKCQVSKWSESSNVFFLLWQFPLLLWIFHWFQNFIFQKKQGFSVFLSYIFFFEVSFLTEQSLWPNFSQKTWIFCPTNWSIY